MLHLARLVLEAELEKPMLRTIRASIKRDAPAFAEYLFPVMGPAIRRAVADALTSLVQRINAIYQFNVYGEHGGSWVVDLKNGAGEVWAGESDSPDCVISMQEDDFMALASGQMNPMNGFLQGRIKVQGNIMMATKLQSLF